MLLLVFRLVLEVLAPYTTSLLTILYKRWAVGPLSPGRDLLADDSLLLRYCLFRRLLANPYWSVLLSARAMGAKLSPTARILGEMGWLAPWLRAAQCTMGTCLAAPSSADAHPQLLLNMPALLFTWCRGNGGV